MNGRRVFYLLLVLGVLACIVFWRVPANKYEWMRTDPVVGDPSAQLPIDEDSWVPLAYFAIAPLVIAVLSLVNAVRLRSTMRLAAIGFSALLLLVVIVKFATS